MDPKTTKRDATKRARVMAEIDRYAAVYARWSRAEATDRQLANARKRVEREVAR